MIRERTHPHLRSGLPLIVLFLWVAQAQGQDLVLKRKNIDDLTVAELAAYEHAIQVLKDRSAANPYDRSGYLWQAWVHNCPMVWVPHDGRPDGRVQCDFWTGGARPGTEYERVHPGWCEHGKDLFLPWHRAQFYYFEKILQQADPDGAITDSRGVTGPSTAKVTVPYWNWTRPPSGERYPKAIEDVDSPLYHAQRNHDPVAKGLAYGFTSPYLIAHQVYSLDWAAFAGRELGVGSFGGLEGAVHNPMHSLYMGGDMASARRAALDPGFFSFHAYIDLLFEEWITDNGTREITSSDTYLRASQPEEITGPPGHSDGDGLPSMGQVKIYLDTRKLGYEYEVLPKDQLPTKAEIDALLNPTGGTPAVFGESARSLMTTLLSGGRFQPQLQPAFIQTLEIRIPTSDDEERFAVFNRTPTEPDLSYQLDLYLYPSAVPFNVTDALLRERYLAAVRVHWGTGAMVRHDDAGPMKIDLTPIMRALTEAGFGGDTWRMSMAITPLPSLEIFGDACVGEDLLATCMR